MEKLRGDREAEKRWWVILNDGEGKEKVWSSGGRSFQRRGAVMDIALLENLSDRESRKV